MEVRSSYYLWLWASKWYWRKAYDNLHLLLKASGVRFQAQLHYSGDIKALTINFSTRWFLTWGGVTVSCSKFDSKYVCKLLPNINKTQSYNFLWATLVQYDVLAQGYTKQVNFGLQSQKLQKKINKMQFFQLKLEIANSKFSVIKTAACSQLYFLLSPYSLNPLFPPVFSITVPCQSWLRYTSVYLSLDFWMGFGSLTLCWKNRDIGEEKICSSQKTDSSELSALWNWFLNFMW